MNPVVEAVTARIANRSKRRRDAYLAFIDRQRDAGPRRSALSCSNLAHAFAASGEDKQTIAGAHAINIVDLVQHLLNSIILDMLVHELVGQSLPLSSYTQSSIPCSSSWHWWCSSSLSTLIDVIHCQPGTV